VNILAIGAHPDDLEYGCGGTLIKYAQRGHNIFLYIATKGELGGDPDLRQKEQETAAGIIGVKTIIWGDYQDTEIPHNRAPIRDIEKAMGEVRPDFIFTHFWDDTHQDHRTLSRCTLSATRYVKNFLFYETPTTQSFSPNVYVDIGEVIKKEKAPRGPASQIAGQISRPQHRGCAESASMFGVFRACEVREAFAS
jgi:LmbE family N-acetylglucosaminyl deacetylase